MSEVQKMPTLAELAEDIFLLVLGFRDRADSIDYDTLNQGVMALFEEFDKKARSLKFDSDAVVDSKYALAAFVDEAILRSQWAGKEPWADNPLQLQLFETYLAGEGFFEKLEALRTRGESAAEVLEVYYLCLALGFEGKYGIEGTERLTALAKLIHDELTRFRPLGQGGISPHWKVVDGPERKTNKLPKWLLYTCAAVIIACLLSYVGFFVSLHIASGSLREEKVSSIIQGDYMNGWFLC